MSIDTETAARVAKLARIRVEEEDLPALLVDEAAAVGAEEGGRDGGGARVGGLARPVGLFA